MTDECISPLRRRMIEDMTVRNFVPKTQSDYIRRVKNFAVFLGRTPDRVSREDGGYLLHLASSGVGAGTVNGTGSALRFFFDVTLDRADIVRHLPIAREPRKAPIVLSPEEVARMLEAAPGLKYKAALSGCPGFVTGFVLLTRVAWRAQFGRVLPPADTGMLYALAKATHYTLYLLLGVVIVTGIVNASYRGFNLFGVWSVPQFGRSINEWHEWAANLTVLVGLLHAAAALVHHYLWRDRLLNRMTP